MNRFDRSLRALLSIALVLTIGGATCGVHLAAAAVQNESVLPAAQIPSYIPDAINAPARPAADRDSDASRQPAQVMAFFGVKPGMQVADLWAGGGYTTELLARIVGSTGKVYSQNIQFPDKFKKAEASWKAGLKAVRRARFDPGRARHPRRRVHQPQLPRPVRH